MDEILPTARLHTNYHTLDRNERWVVMLTISNYVDLSWSNKYLNLTEEYPELAKECKRGNVKSLELFCKLQGWVLLLNEKQTEKRNQRLQRKGAFK